MLVQKEANTSGSSAESTTQPKSLFGGGGGGGGGGGSGGGSATANTPAARKTASHSHTHSTSSFFRSVANLSLAPTKMDQDPPLSQADADLLRDYDNLFRIFYNYPPMLDSINIADAYVQCKSLLTLGDQYDALAVVGPRVDHHLLQFQSRLWKQIAKYPVSYLRLGYLSRSKVIFQEALIHVVGQWPAGERSIRQSFPDIVLDIIEDKVDELEETVSRIEGRLFRLNLTNSRGERVTPNTSYLDWLAVSFFRQWLADNTAPAPLPPPASSSRGHSSRSTAVVASTSTAPNLASLGRTYRTLGSTTGANYLGHDECKRFLKLTPEFYSRDNLRRFEKRIDELKSAAREIVRPLMGSGLELELERGAATPGTIGVGTPGTPGTPAAPSGLTSYLTCVRVMERDLPWSIDD